MSLNWKDQMGDRSPGSGCASEASGFTGKIMLLVRKSQGLGKGLISVFRRRIANDGCVPLENQSPASPFCGQPM